MEIFIREILEKSFIRLNSHGKQKINLGLSRSKFVVCILCDYYETIKVST